MGTTIVTAVAAALFLASAVSAADNGSDRERKDLEEDITAVATVVNCGRMGICMQGQAQIADPVAESRLRQLCRRYRERYHGMPYFSCGTTPEMICDSFYDYHLPWGETTQLTCSRYPTAPCCKDKAAFDGWHKTWERHRQSAGGHVYTDKR